MTSVKNLSEFKKTINSLPVFVLLDSLYSRSDNSPLARSKTASQKYGELLERLHETLYTKLRQAAGGGVREMPFTTLFSLAEMVLLSTSKVPEICLEVMNPQYGGDPLVTHSLNVGYLSTRVGIGLGLPYQELTQLCVAALVHDIGMTQLDMDCYTAKEELSDAERTALEQHPKLGWHFFKHLKDEFPWLLRVIIEEHKREHDQGYPEKAPAELHRYSKIVGVCDTFEALTHQRIFRKAFHPADAIKYIIEAKETTFSKEVLKGMLDSLGMYPVGSLVKLNNERIAQVIGITSGSPLQPVVMTLPASASDEHFEQERIDLAVDTNVYISGLVYSDLYQIPENKKSL